VLLICFHDLLLCQRLIYQGQEKIYFIITSRKLPSTFILCNPTIGRIIFVEAEEDLKNGQLSWPFFRSSSASTKIIICKLQYIRLTCCFVIFPSQLLGISSIVVTDNRRFFINTLKNNHFRQLPSFIIPLEDSPRMRKSSNS
jgi:hypothetical protein